MKKKTLSKSPKRRGAQPGNTNALKHGLYQQYFTDTDIKDPAHTLVNEIVMLRVIIARLLSKIKRQSAPDLANTLTVLSKASATLARLIETEHRLTGNQSDLLNAIRQAVTLLDDLTNAGFEAEDPPDPADPDFS